MNGMEKEIVEVALDDIIPNRFQPRLSFDENGLNELAESIRQHGIIQPLVLRKVGDKYEIIAGERRYKASYIAGLTKVPAVVINLNDNESAEVAIVENIQRRDLSPIEEAKSYKKLLDRGYLTQDELAGRMGKTQATISNKLRLLNLDEKVQEALLNNKISERHARSLLRIENKDEQRELLDEIINKRLNVRDTENLINEKLGKAEDNYVPVSGLSNINNSEHEETDLLEFPKFMTDINNKEEKINFSQIQPTDEISSEVPVNNENLVDVNDFFNVENSINTETVNPVENQYDLNKFMTNFNDIEEIETLPDFSEQEKSNSSIKSDILPFDDVENSDINIVINKVKNLIDEINSLGFKVKLEEYDFEKLYQFIIKIEKN